MNFQAALALMRKAGPLEAFRQIVEENDALICSAHLDSGQEIAADRTVACTASVAHWAERQRVICGYSRPFAVVALGGTGREEIAPCSDRDFAFLFDDEIEGNSFLLELQRQTLHTTEFEQAHGFDFAPMPFTLDDMADLEGKNLNSFLDMRAIYDPDGIALIFRDRIRATYDPFEHFLHVCGLWKEQIARCPACERLDRFDVKNDALRIFQGGVWTLAGKSYEHSHAIHRTQVDRRDLDAYYFLLRIRAWVHLRRPPGGRAGPTGNHAEDVLTFEDFASFGDMLGPDADDAARFAFANNVRERLLSARRRVLGFARGVIERELREGRHVAPGSPIACGAGGLYHATSQRARSGFARSRAALSLLHASQRYGVPVDLSELQATFHNAGDWLERVPEVAALFYETHGSLARTFAFLSQVDGAEARLFPGRAQFEASFDRRVLAEQRELRGAAELRKLQALEQCIAQAPAAPGKTGLAATSGDAVALLDSDHLAAVKLALKTKRLPVTAEDEAVRADTTRQLHERYASGFSGIPLSDYYLTVGVECGFSVETITATQFLVANRRAFKLFADEGQNDRRQVEAFLAICGTEQRLHALYVFTCADRCEWESESSEPARWFSIRELYLKTQRAMRGLAIDSVAELSSAGFAPEDQCILGDFGEDFFGGLYHRHANRFGTDLVRLAHSEEPAADPKAALLHDGAALILAVAARDFRGLAASISGALWQERVVLRRAHFFSAINHGLALDFFHLDPGAAAPSANLPRIVEEAVRARRNIAAADGNDLPRLGGAAEVQESRPGQFRLRCQIDRDTGGVIYALCLNLHRHLRADIHGLTATASRSGSFITIHHSLPESLTLEAARQIIRDVF